MTKRWAVEHTSSWLQGGRRLKVDDDRLSAASKAFIQTAMLRLMQRRLA